MKEQTKLMAVIGVALLVIAFIGYNGDLSLQAIGINKPTRDISGNPCGCEYIDWVTPCEAGHFFRCTDLENSNRCAFEYADKC